MLDVLSAWVLAHWAWLGGLTLSMVGYGFTIRGAWLLYHYAPPNLGVMGVGALSHEFRTWHVPPEQTEAEVAEIEMSARKGRRGFQLIVIGTVFQLVGTVVSAVASL